MWRETIGTTGGFRFGTCGGFEIGVGGGFHWITQWYRRKRKIKLLAVLWWGCGRGSLVVLAEIVVNNSILAQNPKPSQALAIN